MSFSPVNHVWARYAIALGAVAVVILLRTALQGVLREQSPLVFVILAIMVSGSLGGLGPGLLTTFLGTGLCTLLFYTPRPDADSFMAAYGFPIGLFLVAGVGMSIVCELMHSSMRQTRAYYAEQLKLKDQLAQHSHVLNHLTEGVSLVDEAGIIEFTNPATEQLFGYGPGEMIGRHVGEQNNLSAEENRKLVQSMFDTLRETGEWHGELPRRRKDGTPFYTFARINSVDRGGKRYWACVQHDITELRKIRHEREQLLESERAARLEAERAGRLKDEFLATLSHELRTPLTAIVGWAQLMQRGRDKPQLLEDGIDAITRNARIQTQLIEDLLDLSRIVSGKLRLEMNPVDIQEVVRAALASIAPTARNKEITLVADLQRDVPVILGDSNRLQQVIWNLLTNAVKFTPRGGTIRIELRKESDNQIIIHVEDNGQGIEPAFLQHIFKRFRQGDATASRQHGGLGIGLSLVKQFVELHGGQVAVQSEGAGKGSRFTICLPSETHPASAGHVSPRRGDASDDEKPLSPFTVLFVDDDDDTRVVISRMLDEQGATVLLARNAMEAMHLLKRDRPDVLLCDIGMPDVDGYELIRRVRALPLEQGGNIPAIAVTAFARSEDRERALQAGFQSHLCKPVDSARLVAAIGTLGTKSELEVDALGNI